MKQIFFTLLITSVPFSRAICSENDGQIVIGQMLNNECSANACIAYLTNEKATAEILLRNSTSNTSTDVISAKTQRGVVVSTQSGSIVINGTVDGETVSVYNAAGSLVKNVKAQSDNTVISGLALGNVYVVKIGGTSVKVAM